MKYLNTYKIFESMKDTIKYYFNKIETINNIEVIGKKEIKMYIDYTIDKYGKNFIDLYEN